MARKIGFFAVDRNIERWKWYTDANTFRVWMHILIECNYLPGESHGISIKPGQWLTSYQHISTDLKITKSQTRTAIEHLKMTREIACEIAGYGLLITVINWDKYNSKENKSHGISHGMSSENRTGDSTVNRTNITNNKQINKETIKDLEDKRSCDSEKTSPSPAKLSTRFVKPTVDEIADYANSIGFESLDAEYFWNYYQSNGWKVGRNPMKDWRATVRTWRRNDQSKNKPRKEKLAF